METPVQRRRKEKGTRTTTPNHADETQPVQHSKAEGPRGKQSPHKPRGPAGGAGPPRQQHSCPAWAALACHSQPPFLLGARGRQPSPYSLREREGAYKIGVMYGITLHQVYAFRNLSRRHPIFSGRQQRMWQKGLRAVLPRGWAGPEGP